jgi:hypothetical protein
MRLSDAELEAISKLTLSPNPGQSLGPYLLGYVGDMKKSEAALIFRPSLFFDAVFLGVVIQLYIRWETFSAGAERITTKLLVVSESHTIHGHMLIVSQYYLMLLSCLTSG